MLPLELSLLQSHKLPCSVMIHIRVFHIRFDREEKWLTHSSTFTDPSTLATQTGWRESSSICQCPGTPLKDKTTTIRLHFPASSPPHISGYVHSNPILSLSTSVFIQYHSIRSAWYVKKVTVPSLRVRAWKTLNTAETLQAGDSIDTGWPHSQY